MTSTSLAQQLAEYPQFLPLPQWCNAHSLLKTLTSSIIQYDALAIGNRLAPFIPDMLAGMKITSQLIHTVNDESLFSILKAAYKTDIRLTSHYQPYNDFLADIQQHRFDFILVDLNDDNSYQQLLPLALPMLNDNGMLCLLSEQPYSKNNANNYNQSLLENEHIVLMSKAREKPQRRRKQR